MKKLAIIAITQNGISIAASIKDAYPNADLLTLKEKGLTFDTALWTANWDTLKELTKDSFSNYDGFLYIMATGIVVRMIAPYIVAKDHDPAVVVIDEKGLFTISLLSGHLGGGNDLAKEVSTFLQNHCVITTATDVNNKYALDSFARDHGLKIDPITKIAAFNKAILHNKTIHIVADRGIRFDDFHPSFPVSQFCHSADKKSTSMYAMVSHKLYPEEPNRIFLRPSNLILGVGCKKDFPEDVFENNILDFLEKNQLSLLSIREMRSISIKKDEKAMLAFSKKYKIPYVTYRAEEINKIYDRYPNLEKSDFVYKNTGAWGVSEPVSLISENRETIKILIKKTEISGMTATVSIEDPITIKKKSHFWLKD